MNILDHLPAFRKSEAIELPDGSYYTAKAGQIVVVVSLKIGDHLTTAFPAFLDPGNNFNFYMSEAQIRTWLKEDPLTMEKLGELKVNGQDTVLRRADLALYQNRRGTRATTGKTYDFNFAKIDGIAVSPKPLSHLPVLGIRGIFRQKLNLLYDGKTIFVSLSD